LERHPRPRENLPSPSRKKTRHVERVNGRRSGRLRPSERLHPEKVKERIARRLEAVQSRKSERFLRVRTCSEAVPFGGEGGVRGDNVVSRTDVDLLELVLVVVTFFLGLSRFRVNLLRNELERVAEATGGVTRGVGAREGDVDDAVRVGTDGRGGDDEVLDEIFRLLTGLHHHDDVFEVDCIDGVADVELEDDVVGEDVLDRRNNVLRLALRQLDRLRAASEDLTVLGKFGNFDELRGVGGLRLAGGRSRGGGGAGVDGGSHWVGGILARA
jgi:hypothetical protein